MLTSSVTAAQLAASERELEQRIIRNLPGALRSGLAEAGPTSELLQAVAAMLAPAASTIRSGSALFDPLTAPLEMLPWLSGWFGWEWLFEDSKTPGAVLSINEAFPPGAEQLRTLLVAWPLLFKSRGTPNGLRLTLECASGVRPFTVEQDINRQHITVIAPAIPSPWLPWLRRVVANERPVHLGWSLVTTGAGELTGAGEFPS